MGREIYLSPASYEAGIEILLDNIMPAEGGYPRYAGL